MTDEQNLETAARLLRSAPNADRPDLTERIMGAVAARPRPVRAIRRRYEIPVASAAAAAILLFVAIRSYDSPRVIPAPAPQGTVVRFELVDPNATSVALVGDFNGWNVTAAPLRRHDGARPWSAELRLPPGRFTYSFVIDGRRWVADPAAARAPSDDFDSPSSVVVVPTSKARL